MVDVVGSGFAAQSLSPGNVGLELLENSLAIAAGLFVIINILAPVSGAHFNPVVSMVDAWIDTCSWFRAFIYMPFQFLGCIVGAIVANLMFGRTWVSWSTHHRASATHSLSEIGATAGLIFLVFALQRHGGGALHLCGVLRDLFGDIRQSGRHRGARLHEQLHRHRAKFIAGLRRRSNLWRRPGRRPDDAALPTTGIDRDVTTRCVNVHPSGNGRRDLYA
jgi:hypothetical protein